MVRRHVEVEGSAARPIRRSGRRRVVLASVVLALGGAAAACGPVGDSPPGCPAGPPDAFSSTTVNRVNADRRASGMGAVGWSGRLACLAGDASARMAASGRLVHTDLGATIRSPGYEGYTRLAENILTNSQTLSGDAAHDLWMSSPPHRANVLGDVTAIGVAWARSADGRFWAAEELGR